MTTTALVELGENTLEVIEQIEGVLDTCSMHALVDATEMKRAFQMAKGMQALRQILTEPVMRDVMSLMNTPLGFRTDRDPSRGKQWNARQKKMVMPEPYPLETVRDCTIEALMRGLRMTGNEWNIISSSCYTTKEGYKRLVREIDGLHNLHYELAAPQFINENVARVEFSATWNYRRKPYVLVGNENAKDAMGNTIDTRIPIRVNAGMGADAILGKAERKLLARIHNKLTGLELENVDDDVQDFINAEPQGLIAAEAVADEPVEADIEPPPGGETDDELVAEAAEEGLEPPPEDFVLADGEIVEGVDWTRILDSLEKAKSYKACDDIYKQWFPVVANTDHEFQLQEAVDNQKRIIEERKASKK